MDTQDKFNNLITVIEEAGALARDYFFQEENFDQKNDQSVVTEIDTKTEAILRNFVAKYFPEDTIVGEEGDDAVGSSGYVWYIDPIDGTENFVRKIPLFSVTAARLGPTPEDSCAIVHNPVSGQTFASFMEGGVYENKTLSKNQGEAIGGRRAIHVLSSKYEPWIKSAKHNLVQSLGKKYGRSASFSSGLLEFAYVAAGRLDGVVSLFGQPWDTAAGLYLNKAAGSDISIFKDGAWEKHTGAIRDLYGLDYRERQAIIVSHPVIHEELCGFIGDPERWSDPS